MQKEERQESVDHEYQDILMRFTLQSVQSFLKQVSRLEWNGNLEVQVQRLAWRNTCWYLFQIALLFNGSCYQWEWVPWAAQKEMSLEVSNFLG